MRALAVLLLAVATAVAGCADDGGNDVVLDTGGLHVGDPTDAAAEAGWIDDRGVPIPDLVPDFVAVCDAGAGCDEIVGFVDARDLYPQLAPPDDPRNSQLGYQPPPSRVVDEHGHQVGWMMPDIGFVPLDD